MKDEYYKKLGNNSYYTFKGVIYPENYKKGYMNPVSVLVNYYPSEWQEVPAGDYFVQENKLPGCFRVKIINHPLREKYIEWWKNEFNSKLYYEGELGKFYGFDSYDRTNMLNADINGNLPENAIELTLEQWDKIVNKNVIEEFKLPEKWCVKPSKETSEWFNKNSQTNARDYDTINCGYLHYPKVTKYLHHYDTIQSGYTEITFEQFIKYVLKEEIMNKEITGYKLKEGCEHYRKAAEEITGFRNPSNSEEYFAEFFKKKLLLDGAFINKLKEAGVLDLWFEPIYKEEIPDIEVGDYIYIINAHGAYKEQLSEYNGDILKVISFEKENFHLYPNAYWLRHTPESFSGGGFRVHGSAWEYGVDFRKATKEEILKHLQVEFTKRTGIDIDSNVQETNRRGIISYGKVEKFFLHIKGKEKGNYSTLTHNWFDDNPNEKYQLGIELKDLGVMSPNCTLSKPKLKFGGYDVIFEKVSSGVRITCAGETSTLSQVEQIYDFITTFPTLKFGSQRLEKIEFPVVNVHLDDLQVLPYHIKIGCTIGTWKEFCNILDEARKLNKC